MFFETPLLAGHLIRRYKRFLADVRLDNGTTLTCHCPNTGSMLGCATPGARIWLSTSDNPRRKYAHTWELVEADNGVLTGIHTGRANALVAEALENGALPAVAGLHQIKPEARQPGGRSRIDFRLAFRDDRADCFLEVKNVTAAVNDGVALFPDAVSERGTRHLEALMQLREEGYGAMLVFCVQRGDVQEVRPADSIDPVYGAALRQAIAAGVMVGALGARVSPQEIRLCRPLPVVCP
ncbi:DNA/RNA nuclease SfsA [Methylonatrum kenyense]|uniref:DNA/RNA nuclease SfsA n=1 Tax=Methylonatrum kenyense TaxID=455253 RepID=UPI0020BEF401|nr:DNA/RNA nuclease SfsA [Methylonatrum kenyense]MCK8516476.1 DNA/RNA nuclease SfsA [Methylonatrum kenyense]